MRKITVFMQTSATDDEMYVLVRYLEGHPITGAVTVVNDEAVEQPRALDANQLRDDDECAHVVRDGHEPFMRQ